VEQSTYTNAAGETKRPHLYLPPNYHRGTDRYPVLYLNHGGGDDDAKWTSTDRRNGGSAQFILDNLIRRQLDGANSTAVTAAPGR